MKNIIAIASGKGGVGKSTVATNLAVSLANYPLSGRSSPLKVGLIDVDFYGPSIPTLMGAAKGGDEIKVDADKKFIPAFKYGVKYISIAFFLKNPDDPIIWRGPMFTKGIEQLFKDTSWGDLDICILDLPPGTGDAQISLSQMVQLTGAVLVTTPQEVALADVRRAVNMFRRVNVPILGVVENMAGFKQADGSIVDIFGKGGGEELCKEYGLNLLSKIPLIQEIREGGDNGEPATLRANSEIASLYRDFANNLAAEITKVSKTSEQLQIIN